MASTQRKILNVEQKTRKRLQETVKEQDSIRDQEQIKQIIIRDQYIQELNDRIVQLESKIQFTSQLQNSYIVDTPNIVHPPDRASTIIQKELQYKNQIRNLKEQLEQYKEKQQVKQADINKLEFHIQQITKENYQLKQTQKRILDQNHSLTHLNQSLNREIQQKIQSRIKIRSKLYQLEMKQGVNAGLNKQLKKALDSQSRLQKAIQQMSKQYNTMETGYCRIQEEIKASLFILREIEQEQKIPKLEQVILLLASFPQIHVETIEASLQRQIFQLKQAILLKDDKIDQISVQYNIKQQQLLKTQNQYNSHYQKQKQIILELNNTIQRFKAIQQKQNSQLQFIKISQDKKTKKIFQLSQTIKDLNKKISNLTIKYKQIQSENQSLQLLIQKCSENLKNEQDIRQNLQNQCKKLKLQIKKYFNIKSVLTRQINTRDTYILKLKRQFNQLQKPQTEKTSCDTHLQDTSSWTKDQEIELLKQMVKSLQNLTKQKEIDKTRLRMVIKRQSPQQKLPQISQNRSFIPRKSSFH